MGAGTVDHETDDQAPDALSEVLTTARAAVDREFEIAERLDGKARGLVTIGAQWFAIAQAVAAVAFATKHPDSWMLWTVGITAIVGAVALGFLAAFCWSVWKIRDEPAVKPTGLIQMRNTVAQEQSSAALVDHYAAMLRDRREPNKARADALEDAQIAWFFVMAVPLVELGFALATRLLS